MRVDQNLGMQCPVQGCNRVVRAITLAKREVKIARHLSRSECSNGSNPSRRGKSGPGEVHSLRDRGRLCMRDSGVTNVKWMRVDKSTPAEDLHLGPNAGKYKRCDGDDCRISPVARGYACKPKRRTTRSYTIKQLDFIEWCYMQGVPGVHGGSAATKYSSDRAESKMRNHGTFEGAKEHPAYEYWNPIDDVGERTFSVREQLNHWVFKQWFSYAPDKFKRSMIFQKKKSLVTIHEVIVDDVDDFE